MASQQPQKKHLKHKKLKSMTTDIQKLQEKINVLNSIHIIIETNYINLYVKASIEEIKTYMDTKMINNYDIQLTCSPLSNVTLNKGRPFDSGSLNTSIL